MIPLSVTITKELYDELIDVLGERMFIHTDEDEDEDNDDAVINVRHKLMSCWEDQITPKKLEKQENLIVPNVIHSV